MAVTVRVGTTYGIGTKDCTATEIGVSNVNTGINTVEGNAGTGSFVVDKVSAASLTVRDSAEAPGGGVPLNDESLQVNLTVMFDIVDLVNGFC